MRKVSLPRISPAWTGSSAARPLSPCPAQRTFVYSNLASSMATCPCSVQCRLVGCNSDLFAAMSPCFGAMRTCSLQSDFARCNSDLFDASWACWMQLNVVSLQAELVQCDSTLFGATQACSMRIGLVRCNSGFVGCNLGLFGAMWPYRVQAALIHRNLQAEAAGEVPAVPGRVDAGRYRGPS
jgi:hypothetical protein